jgi:hypothetical protein
MTRASVEFMRRFLLHVLPGRFHRIQHDGLPANGSRKANLALVRELLHVVPVQAAALSSDEQADALSDAVPPTFICRHCGHMMIILQLFVRGQTICAPAAIMNGSLRRHLIRMLMRIVHVDRVGSRMPPYVAANRLLHAQPHALDWRWTWGWPHAAAIWQCQPKRDDRHADARIPIAPVH